MNRRAILKTMAALPSAFTIPAAAAPVVAPATPDPVWAAIGEWVTAREALDVEMARIKGTGEDLDDEFSSAELDAAVTLVATVPTTLDGLFALILTTQAFDPFFFEDDGYQGFSFALSLAESVKALRKVTA